MPFVNGMTNRYTEKNREGDGHGIREGYGSWSEVPVMLYSVQQIANYFIERARLEGRPITPLKLLKLVYIAYGWYIALTDRRLFTDRIEAWKHGPVIPSIYHEFKDFGSNPINRYSMNFDLDTFEATAPFVPDDEAETRLILDRVWESYKNFSGWELRNKTHEPDSPWSRVYDEGVRGKPLEDGHIREHFTTKIRGYLNASHPSGRERAPAGGEGHSL